MFAVRPSALTLLLLATCATPVYATEFVTGYALDPNASVQNWNDPASLNSSQTLFVWGFADDANNSVRTLTYAGTQQYLLTGLSQSSVVQNTSGASGGVAAYDDSVAIVNTDVAYTLTLNGGSLNSHDVIFDTDHPTLAFLDDPTPVSGTTTINGGELSNRLIKQNTVLTFTFFNNGSFGTSNGTPNAIFTAPVLISLQGDAVNPTIGVSPPGGVAFGNQRTGTTPGPSANITISNTGSIGSELDGTAAAATGTGFSSATTNFALLKTTAANPSAPPVAVTFTPRSAIGHTDTNGIADTGSVAITSNDPTTPSTSQALSGTTVSPIFAYKYDGADVTGTTLDLNATELSAGGILDLALANLFGTNLGNLTDWTFISAGLNGDSAFTLNLAPTPGDRVQSLAQTPLKMLFSGTAPGTYSTILSVWGDDNQVLCTNTATCARTEHLLAVNVTVSGVPVPATIFLLMSGIAGIALRRRA